VRLFVAIELDRALRRALARAAEPIVAAERCLRATSEEQIHLTLRFVGETPDDRIADVIEAAEAAAAPRAPFSIQVRGLGGFPKPQAVRVLWAGIEECQPLGSIARAVETELRNRGFPPESRGFSPHVTIARAKGAPSRRCGPLDPEQPRFGEQEVDELVVFESRPSPRGSLYVPVARAALEGLDEGARSP
jgi:2'-5' RNA ligase